MKRLITSAALVLVAAVGILGVNFRMPTELRADEQRELPVTTKLDDFVLLATPTDQRQQLLERLKAKVELMSDEDVQQALEATDAEIRTLRAEFKLQEAVSILRSVVEEFEGTPPASKAKRMLKALEVPTDI